ncbi:Vacuolar protein sorting-associated protein 26 [Perilla frutescens var. hirtella]|uniref:Vacuolar protein sorting-associated protein 26C n=1 Tax=Perilla frutescens var. hirtella TaxID=608512 RepID=A0AAD4IWJ5_PERFH|nr:Vacuolar protein sorting-associated protein 26 [Perilla frutescens var. hirtella]
MSVEIKLSRFNRIYRPNELLEGKIITKLNSSLSYQSIRLTLNGAVNLQVRGGSAGVIESLYGVIKPSPIMKKVVDIQSSGKIGSGTTEIPFSVILKDPKENNLGKFYETFHGGNISIQYLVTVDIVRGYLHKPLSATIEFIVESDKDNLPQKPISPEMVIFYITQDTQRHTLLPQLKSGGFRITGRICTQCSLSDPIGGEITVEASAVPIRSIDIHLLRVESILIGEKIATESSIADGDVCHGMTLPIYIILPRLLTCPTIFAGPFSIEFKLSIVITFTSDLYKKHAKADPISPKPWCAIRTGPHSMRLVLQVLTFRYFEDMASSDELSKQQLPTGNIRGQSWLLIFQSCPPITLKFHLWNSEG